jgi:hypothetical protein
MDSLMRQYAADIMKVTAAYVATAARWHGEFTEFQNSLDLAGIFDPRVLLCGEQRRAARNKVDCVARALEQQKRFYRSLVVDYSREVLSCASSLPEAEKAAIREPLLARLQGHVSEQAYFHRLRERWIAAVRSLIAIFDAPNLRVAFDGELFVFEDDDELGRFIALLTEIDDVAATEAALMEARVIRMQEQAGVLGIPIR